MTNPRKLNFRQIKNWIEAKSNSIPTQKFLNIHSLFDIYKRDNGKKNDLSLKVFKRHANTCSDKCKFLLKVENKTKRYQERYVILPKSEIHLCNKYLSGNI